MEKVLVTKVDRVEFIEELGNVKDFIKVASASGDNSQ